MRCSRSAPPAARRAGSPRPDARELRRGGVGGDVQRRALPPQPKRATTRRRAGPTRVAEQRPRDPARPRCTRSGRRTTHLRGSRPLLGRARASAAVQSSSCRRSRSRSAAARILRASINEARHTRKLGGDDERQQPARAHVRRAPLSSIRTSAPDVRLPSIVDRLRSAASRVTSTSAHSTPWSTRR